MTSKLIRVWCFIFLAVCFVGNFGTSVGIAADIEEMGAKTILVTGANKGIGYALTKQLLEDGHQVFAVARHTEPLQELQVSFRDSLHIIEADLGTDVGQDAVAPAVIGALDYIVHNAAVMDPVGDSVLLNPSKKDALRNMLRVNQEAPIMLTNMLADKVTSRTRHLFVSSRAGDSMYKGVIPYCVTKHTMDSLVEGLRVDNPGFLAATIHPGEVNTTIQEVLRAPLDSEFALAPVFVKTNAEGKLLPPEIAARFFKWVLFGTDDTEFVSRKHNIYADTDTYPHWVPEGVTIVNPYP